MQKWKCTDENTQIHKYKKYNISATSHARHSGPVSVSVSEN